MKDVLYNEWLLLKPDFLYIINEKSGLLKYKAIMT